MFHKFHPIFKKTKESSYLVFLFEIRYPLVTKNRAKDRQCSSNLPVYRLNKIFFRLYGCDLRA